jgi:hypothetical protein
LLEETPRQQGNDTFIFLPNKGELPSLPEDIIVATPQRTAALASFASTTSSLRTLSQRDQYLLQIVLSARILAFESSLVIFDDEFPPTTATAPLFDDFETPRTESFLYHF